METIDVDDKCLMLWVVCKCVIPHWKHNYVKPHVSVLCMDSTHTAPI